MKAFVMAMLAAGAALLLAALFWPDRPQSASQRQRHSTLIVATADSTEREPAQEHNDLQPTTPAMPTPAISVRRSTDDAPFTPPTANKPALEPIPNQPANAHLSDEQLTFKQTGTDNTS